MFKRVDKVFRSSKNNLFEYYDKEKSTESTQSVCSILHIDVLIAKREDCLLNLLDGSVAEINL